ncbi:hypothetical protein [uncultured Parabacteroides sp.]|uniref:TRAFAC clade GTPase domain-containing protein n=1 Tax=uncultured Parabacteroides sp. TaxID=512312 RepID=UPI0025EF2F80|nr:hypothetical protein [uncultured Parabacteroides sp.]
MGKELKVLMMGGQRVGKSSALAAIMDAFTNGSASSVFRAKDTTVLQKVGREQQTSVSQRLLDSMEWLKRNEGKIILTDSGRTNIRWDYSLELRLNNTNDTMKMTFTDVNGEWFELNNPHSNEVRTLVSEYDVFIVAVDTTFLMEAKNPVNKLVSPVKNEKHNCIQEIHNMLTSINDNNGQDAKLVIFVPIKCEYWVKKGLVNEVTQSVTSDYKTAIIGLCNSPSVQVEILPIQTLGSASYHSHTEPLVFNYSERNFFFMKTRKSQRCMELEDGKVRLSDGTIHDIAKGSVEDDPMAVMIKGTTIMRPHTWYSVDSSVYRPYNCDQVAFHILEFMLAKRIDIEIRKKEEENGIVRKAKIIGKFILNVYSLGLWNKLCDIFGDISVAEMTNAVDKLNNLGVIRHSGDGITIIKRCNFKKI